MEETARNDQISVHRNDFWQAFLDNAQPSQFPAAMPRGAECRAPGERPFVEVKSLEIDHETAIPDAILITAWALAVSLHTLSNDVVFGLSSTHSHNNLLPFRVPVPESGGTGLDLIASVQSSLDRLAQHGKKEDVVLEDIQMLNANCRAACAFPSALEISSEHSTDAASSNNRIKVQSCSVLVSCVSTVTSTRFTLHADESAYTQPFLHTLLRHFSTAVISLSADTSSLIDQINWLSPTELEQIETWAQEPEPLAEQRYLHRVIEEQACLHPLSIAIGQTDSVMTYAELNEGATALAEHLLKTKSVSGNIAVLFSKSAFAIVSMLAVLKAGCAFVPIDKQWPTKRIEKIFESAQIKVVLCSVDQQEHLRPFSNINVVIVTPKSIYGLKKSYQRSTQTSLPKLQKHSPAYIMHTSGSTGHPKGVEISHQSITTSINAMARYFDLSSSTRTLQFSALTFDVSVADIWVTLANGGRVCMPSEKERFNLNEFMIAERCNFAFITPSVAATIDPEIAKNNMCRLAVIGEAVKSDFLRRYAPSSQDGNDYVLSDTWGPTEASVFGTGSEPITIGEDGQTLVRRAGNIGRPVGCGVFILSTSDPHKLSPAYAPGEIALVGPTLANGYWGDKAKTDSAFPEDLEWTRDERWTKYFGGATTKRVYLTGDIGRYSEEGDGSVVFMHRRGGYMKVNGLRIDPGEVESAVVEIGIALTKDSRDITPSWERIAVTMLEGVSGNEQQQTLVCFLANSEEAGRPGAGCHLVDLSEQIKRLLRKVASGLKDVIPEYMVPGLFVTVAQMPYTTSFKLDRQALLRSLSGLKWSELVHKFAVNDEGMNRK